MSISTINLPAQLRPAQLLAVTDHLVLTYGTTPMPDIATPRGFTSNLQSLDHFTPLVGFRVPDRFLEHAPISIRENTFERGAHNFSHLKINDGNPVIRIVDTLTILEGKSDFDDLAKAASQRSAQALFNSFKNREYTSSTKLLAPRQNYIDTSDDFLRAGMAMRGSSKVYPDYMLESSRFMYNSARERILVRDQSLETAIIAENAVVGLITLLNHGGTHVTTPDMAKALLKSTQLLAAQALINEMDRDTVTYAYPALSRQAAIHAAYANDFRMLSHVYMQDHAAHIIFGNKYSFEGEYDSAEKAIVRAIWAISRSLRGTAGTDLNPLNRKQLLDGYERLSEQLTRYTNFYGSRDPQKSSVRSDETAKAFDNAVQLLKELRKIPFDELFNELDANI